MKGLDDEWGQPRYYVSKCIVFGVATGPLIWPRLAAAAMRVAQSAMLSYETDIITLMTRWLCRQQTCRMST